MLCDVCQDKHATVYLTQIVDGQMQKVNLCEGCAKEKGVTDPTGFALADLLLGLGTDEKVSQPRDEKVCETCGFSHSDFKKTGRLGCSDCYNTFGDGLDSLVKAMHRGTKHVGKVPTRYQATKQFSDKISDLKHRLKIAITDENFEEAAKLRDQIKAAEEEFANAKP